MKILWGASWSRLIEALPEERRWLDTYTSCETGSYRSGQWGQVEDRYRMLDILTMRFPTGFVPMLQRAAKRDGHDFEIVNEYEMLARTPPDLTADIAWLRDYQLAAVQAVAKHGRGLLKMPTASGKTECFVALTKVIPCEWLFVTHRADLVDQAAKRYQLRTAERAGKYGGGRWERGTCNVTVSTFQALWRGLKKKEPAARQLVQAMEAVCVDEVHAQPAASFFNCTMALVNATYRVGLSGTPLDRSDQDSLRTLGSVGPVIYRLQTQELVKRGVLARSDVRMIPCHQKMKGGDWLAVYRALIVDSVPRNKLLAQIIHKAAKPCLVFVDQLDHGKNLQRELLGLGIEADFASGKDWLAARSRKVAQLVSGDIQSEVLICTVIFQEGIDIPQLASVVAGGGKSSVVGTLQRIGRGMRTAEGKLGFEAWDILDRGQTWLAKHSDDRLEAYQKEGHEVQFGFE